MAECSQGAQPKNTSEAKDERISKIKTYKKAAFADIQKALTFDEQGNTKKASEFYCKGLKSLKKGLEIKCNEQNCHGKDWDEAREMQKMMRKTLRQMKARLESLEKSSQSRVVENGVENGLTDAEIENLNGNLQMEEELMELGEPPSYLESEANADEVFSVADGAQIYFINNKGHVSTPSMPSSLRIYEFTDEIKAQNPNKPPAFLQVCDWLYPLVKGQAPVLKSNDGAFIFLDMMTPEEGSSVGVMFTDAVNRATRVLFEETLKSYATVAEQNADGTVQMPRQPPPRPPPPQYSVQDANADRTGERANEEGEEEKHRPPGWSTSVSKGLAVGATWISWGLGKGAEVTVKYIDKGSKKVKSKLKPAAEPAEIKEKYQTGMQQARAATAVAVKVSGVLIDGLCFITRRLAEEVAPHIRKQGEKYLKSGDDAKDGKRSKTLDGVVHVASSGLDGFLQVYHTLEAASFALAKSIQLATVDVVNHKYGDAAARLTDDTLCTVGNLGVAAYRIDNLGLKAIAKRTAKDTTKAVVVDYKENPAQSTLGSEAHRSSDTSD